MDKKLAENAKVLVIDDQTLAKGYMKYALEELGFEKLYYVDKPKDALSLLRSKYFELVVCTYALKQDHDGYFLYEELKSNNILPTSTAFVFVSADTSTELVRSIVELQPDDFLVKPFTVADMNKRLTRILVKKQALKNIYHLIDKRDFPSALEEAEQFLTMPEKSEFFPQALKIKGELLLACDQPENARDFYYAILNVQDFSWAHLGLVKALLLLHEDEEAEKRLLRLAFKPETELLAYDLITQLNIKKQDFDTALESAVTAANVSPRNLRRHQQAIDLSRITADFKTQFEESKKIAKFAKDSIHDKPENYLNVVRAGIDYALTTDAEESEVVAKQASVFLKQATSSASRDSFDAQITVAHARLMYLQDDKLSAMQLMEQLDSDYWDDASMDDLLDHAKAFHELGLHSQSQSLMDEIERRCQEEDKQSELFLQYIQKEKKQRREITQSPRDLNNSAVQHYQKGDLENALKTFRQAFTVMPKNASIALNLLQTIAIQAQENAIPDSSKAVIQHCFKTIAEGELSDEQQIRFEKIKNFLNQYHYH
ncbi:response regulator [Alteromonas sp. a30]|uniref:response regulator n=1 Tax=Alteromonas sp. a30 TaxID=2730917 RepID=UPI002281CAC2|nr:response regulator [Alteromonas sp. a30]MCY7295236.1 response regulator [Alteromonas sp. a30]